MSLFAFISRLNKLKYFLKCSCDRGEGNCWDSDSRLKTILFLFLTLEICTSDGRTDAARAERKELRRLEKIREDRRRLEKFVEMRIVD